MRFYTRNYGGHHCRQEMAVKRRGRCPCGIKTAAKELLWRGRNVDKISTAFFQKRKNTLEQSKEGGMLVEKKYIVTERYQSQSMAQRRQNLQERMEAYILSAIRQGCHV